MTIKRKSGVTIVDIARVAGVSPQTVSRVINNKADVSDETRGRIQELIEEMGYRPNRTARGLVSQRNWTIGVLITDIANPFFPEVIRGIQAVALDHDYNVSVYNSDNKPHRERQALQLLEESRVDGIIVHAPILPTLELIDLLRRQRSAVLIGRQLPREVAGIVDIDLPAGAAEATQYLLSMGRDRLAYIGHFPVPPERPERLDGIQRALSAAGMDPAELLIQGCEIEPDSVMAAAVEILRSPRNINGILCYNDMIAFNVLKACRALEIRVPEDVAVIGYDDIFFSAYCVPSLTTVHIPKYELGKRAAQMLFDRLDNKAEDSKTVFTPRLVVRDSTPR